MNTRYSQGRNTVIQPTFFIHKEKAIMLKSNASHTVDAIKVLIEYLINNGVISQDDVYNNVYDDLRKDLTDIIHSALANQ